MGEFVVSGSLFKFEECKVFHDQIKNMLPIDNELVVNFKNVENISSTAIGIFFSIQQYLIQIQKNIKVINISPDIKDSLKQFEAAKALPNIHFAGVSDK